MKALFFIVAFTAMASCTRPRAEVTRPGVSAADTAAGGRQPLQPASVTAGVPGVPRIDAATKARLRAVLERGKTRGMRPDVFAKIGDSITESGSFLRDIGEGWFELGDHTDLSETVTFFHRTRVDPDGHDSFARASEAAVAGWTADDALQGPRPSPLEREIAAIRPGVALVMFGTNDIDRSTPEAFEQALGRVADICLERGVIPVLSTIPRRTDAAPAAARVPAYNAKIVAVARARGMPVMDLHAALEPLPRHGLSADGIHPSAFTRDRDVRACDLTPAALRHGYNIRNLLALRTLAKIRAVVIEDGAPDR